MPTNNEIPIHKWTLDPDRIISVTSKKTVNKEKIEQTPTGIKCYFEQGQFTAVVIAEPNRETQAWECQIWTLPRITDTSLAILSLDVLSASDHPHGTPNVTGCGETDPRIVSFLNKEDTGDVTNVIYGLRTAAGTVAASLYTAQACQGIHGLLFTKITYASNEYVSQTVTGTWHEYPAIFTYRHGMAWLRMGETSTQGLPLWQATVLIRKDGLYLERPHGGYYRTPDFMKINDRRYNILQNCHAGAPRFLTQQEFAAVFSVLIENITRPLFPYRFVMYDNRDGINNLWDTVQTIYAENADTAIKVVQLDHPDMPLIQKPVAEDLRVYPAVEPFFGRN